MKINYASQLPYPSSICLLHSCDGEFPWNSLAAQSVVPDWYTASFLCLRGTVKNTHTWMTGSTEDFGLP